MGKTVHQFVDRDTLAVKTEKIFGDRIVNFLYSPKRENASLLYKTLSSQRMSGALSLLNYDLWIGAKITGVKRFCKRLGVDLSECLDNPASLNTPRKIFERKIRYWDVRPMPCDDDVIVSPADAKVIVGSFFKASQLFIKNKFFDLEELVASGTRQWSRHFQRGDYALFRLTPEKYHYNHYPVSGTVLDVYEIDGCYHSCNPGALVSIPSPFSKNKRAVTIIDTDVHGGTRIGLVALIEVVALMVGKIVQCYSESFYDNPRLSVPGMFVKKGQPKSLFQPGSSTDVLVFQKGRIDFSRDLIWNLYTLDARTRFSNGFGMPLVETDLKVRSQIATARRNYDIG